ncbi:MAG: hypothetical protein ACOVOR_04085 [Rhabdochlamydiaceae bacterium]
MCLYHEISFLERLWAYLWDLHIANQGRSSCIILIEGVNRPASALRTLWKNMLIFLSKEQEKTLSTVLLNM